MTVRFYIVPRDQVGSRFGPKYFDWAFDPDPFPEMQSVDGEVAAGTITASSFPTTLTSSTDYYTGRRLTFFEGNNRRVNSIITSYDTGTKVVTCDPFPFAPVEGDEFTISTQWQSKRYGKINMEVIAANVTPLQHTFLSGQSDVWSFGEDLDVAMGASERNALGNFLEVVFVPSQWLSPQDTHRTAARTVTGMFLFMQRLTNITGVSPVDSGLALNTQYRNMPQLWQDAIVQAAADLNYNASWLTQNMTVRTLLKNMSDEWGAGDISFGFVQL